MPDLGLVGSGTQCFPRWRYLDLRGGLFDGLQRVDNITEACLRTCRRHYGDPGIDRDAIFWYCYGVLHSPGYQRRFAANLSRELPRIPWVPQFARFAEIGERLGELHLRYETGPEYPLQLQTDPTPLRPEHCRVGRKRMRWADPERSVIRVNDHIRLAGVPPEAHRYTVCDRSPLEWAFRYVHQSRDDPSGIENDANAWFAEADGLLRYLKRLVYVAVESVRLIDSLPGAACQTAGNQGKMGS